MSSCGSLAVSFWNEQMPLRDWIFGNARPVVLISCVKSKRPYPCVAKDLYCSTLFYAQREFAEALSKQWFILSAQYGLVRPDQRIEPYEKTLNGASVEEKKVWARRVSIDLQNKIAASEPIVITAGENYCRYLIPLLEKRRARSVSPA